MRILIIVMSLWLSSPGFAGELEREALASKFFDATTAKQIDAVVGGVVQLMLRDKPTWTEQSVIFGAWLSELYKSPEYKNIYTSRIVRMFSEDELVELVKLTENPVFITYMQRWQEFSPNSNADYNALQKTKMPELFKRLEAAGFDPYQK